MLIGGTSGMFAAGFGMAGRSSVRPQKGNFGCEAGATS